MSATYLKWAEENHAINRLDDATRYQFLRADITDLLHKPSSYSLRQGYDLILLDPPSFSNSSKMRQTLDIQRDHESLIAGAMRLLAKDGLLVFSTNKRGFRLDQSVAEGFDTRNITPATIPEDFKRRPGIHHCWEIRQLHSS
jgi:23S rRNA G2069 N7-methylase RlmK/C1962 C5-methylase RlmI